MEYITSCSDNNQYPSFCHQSVIDEETFKNFRRNPIYTSIVETVPYKAGRDYLKSALSQTPEIYKYFVKFMSNDTVGNPQTYAYRRNLLSKKLMFSPTTLRYIKVLSDLNYFFKSLDGMKIIEIGGGYGGLCKIISDMFQIKSYTIVDLDPCLKLAKKYLDEFSVKRVNYATSDSLEKQGEYDLVISNYAFSEIERSIQDVYVKKIINNSSRGYMLANFASHTWDNRQYSEQEFLSLKDNMNVFKNTSHLTKIDLNCKISLLLWGQTN